MSELKPPPVIEPEAPQAVVERVGRWTYRVSIEHGIMCYGPNGVGWHVLGLKRAKRKACRELLRYRRSQAREQQRWVITDDLPRPDLSGGPIVSQVPEAWK